MDTPGFLIRHVPYDEVDGGWGFIEVPYRK